MYNLLDLGYTIYKVCLQYTLYKSGEESVVDLDSSNCNYYVLLT